MTQTSQSTFDLIVIGAGPGGYVAAIRAAQLGLKTACVEREYLGGTCLNVGCIPSKALLDSSERYYQAKNDFAKHGLIVGDIKIDFAKLMGRKNEVVKGLTSGVGGLFKKNKIEHLKGHGKITKAGADGCQVQVKAADGSLVTYGAKRVLIATGSTPSQVPALPFDGTNILSSTEMLAITELPKKLLIVGGGYIGVEMGSIWARLGVEVLVLEFMPNILPVSDKEMALALQKSLEKQGLKFKFNTIAEGVKIENGKVKVNWKSGDQTGTEEVDKVLVCVGRRPVTNDLGLESIGITLDKRGFVPVDAHFKTTAPNVYAIGDVIGGIMLAHKAEEEGTAVVEQMAGIPGHVNYATCPSVVYTHPELAAVGLTEEEAKAAAGANGIKVGKFPFLANGRAKGMGETEGFVKIIADAKTDTLLGCHILAAHASDMIAECVTAMEFKASSEDLARTFHAHPTLPEAIKEAALAVEKRQIHL